MSVRPIVPLALATLLLSACISAEPGTAVTVDARKNGIAGEGTDAPGAETSEPDNSSSPFLPLPESDGSNSTGPATGFTVFAAPKAAEWPKNAPAFAPAYPGGTIPLGTVSGSFGGKTLPGAQFSTTDAPAKVIAYYKPLAAAAGLTEALAPKEQGMSLFAAVDSKGDVALYVMAGTTDGTTYVTLYFLSPN